MKCLCLVGFNVTSDHIRITQAAALVSQDEGDGDVAFLGWEGEAFKMEHLRQEIGFHQVSAMEDDEDEDEEIGHMEDVKGCVLEFMRKCR
jgi:hypothetical protein